jgi:D-alanyl-D-alanine carboxypeptidase/D-alanyl-D-alanine-endopeptidase (penicillin-binding protein 4)
MQLLKIAKSFVLIVIVSLLCVPAVAEPGKSLPQDKVDALVAGLARCERSAIAGISAVELSTGRSILAVRENEPRVPGSNQKIVTSAIALEALGGDFNFTTSLYMYGKDLVIVGDFDPAMGDPVLAAAAGKSIYAELDAWAGEVKKKVGRQFDGAILVLGEMPAGGYRHSDWPANQQDRWYAAPVADLNFNNNCIDVSFVSAKPGVAAVISPESKFIPIASKLSLSGKHVWSLKVNNDCSGGTLVGSISGPNPEPYSVAVSDPTMLFARTLGQRLLDADVQCPGMFGHLAQKDFDKSKAELIAQTTRPLAVVMSRANKRSLNMAAEAMFLRACGPTWEQGGKRASELLVKAYGLKDESFTISDGSGLSHLNAISPAAMTKLLLAMSRRKDAGMFIDSLPIAGVDGTMERRLTQEPYKGRVLGKTGYVTGASCLSGYILDTAGRPAIAFAVMVNKISGPANAKRLEEDVCEVLVDSLRGTLAQGQ